MPILTNHSIFTLSIQLSNGGSVFCRPGKHVKLDEKSARVFAGSGLGRSLSRDGLIEIGDTPAEQPAGAPEVTASVAALAEADAGENPSPEDLSALDWSEAVALVQIETDTRKLEAWHGQEKRKRVIRAIEDRILSLVE